MSKVAGLLSVSLNRQRLALAPRAHKDADYRYVCAFVGHAGTEHVEIA